MYLLHVQLKRISCNFFLFSSTVKVFNVLIHKENLLRMLVLHNKTIIVGMEYSLGTKKDMPMCKMPITT